MKMIKEAWTDMRNQPVIGIVTVIGTALAIFLIMMVTISAQVNTMPIAPENNRDRSLHAKFICLMTNDSQGHSSGMISEEAAHDLYFDLDGAEAATVYTNPYASALNADGEPPMRVAIRETDPNYWKVFDFTFIDGTPFSASSQRNSVVLSRSAARHLLGTDKAVGRRLMLNRYEPYTVVGVVDDVSQLADRAYAEAWIPITTKHDSSDLPGLGDFCVTVLARSASDFPKIHADVKRREAQFNLKLEPFGYKLDLFDAPYTQDDAQYLEYSNAGPDTETPRRERLIVYAILLLVPAVNLSTMTQSRLRHKVSEFGVRRAFGCTRRRLVADILTQNFFITLAGGILGLIFSLVFAWMFAGSLLIGAKYVVGSATNISIISLLDWRILLAALGFCFVLNLLSSGIPAWRASRIHVVEAIGGIRK